MLTGNNILGLIGTLGFSLEILDLFTPNRFQFSLILPEYDLFYTCFAQGAERMLLVGPLSACHCIGELLLWGQRS